MYKSTVILEINGMFYIPCSLIKFYVCANDIIMNGLHVWYVNDK